MKVQLGNREMTEEAAHQFAKDRKEWRALVHELLNKFHETILLGPVFSRTGLPCYDGYHQERGGRPLHDAVGINCKNCASTENQGADVKGCMLRSVC